MKRLLFSLFVVVAVGAGAVAWVNRELVRSRRLELDKIATTRGELAARRQQIVAQTGERQKQQLELQRGLETQKATAVPPRPAARPAPATVLRGNAELSKFFRQSYEANLTTKYLPFYRAAGLTAGEITAFEATLAEAELRRMEALAEAIARGIRANEPAAAAARQQQADDLKARLVSVLGADKAEQWAEFKRAEPENEFVTNVAYQVASSSPLTEELRERLLDVLATSIREVGPQASNDTYAYRVLGSTVDWRQALARAKTFLSPTQLAAMEGHMLEAEVQRMIQEFCLREGIPVKK